MRTVAFLTLLVTMATACTMTAMDRPAAGCMQVEARP